MGALAEQHLVFDIQDPGQQLHQRAAGLRPARHHRRIPPMEPHRGFYLELFGHHPAGFTAEFRHRRTVHEARGDAGRAFERNLWKCRRTDRKNRDPEDAMAVLMMSPQVSIVALRDGEIRIVQSSMLGSILSNLLLVLGCCFLAGGIKHNQQYFNSTVASTMSSLMAVSAASLIIPATLYAVMASAHKTEHDKKGNILLLSHGTAIILLLLYVLYLVFQLKTHSELFDEESQPSSPSQDTPSDSRQNSSNHRHRQEEEPTILSPWAAGVALVVITVAVAICADKLVASIDSIVETAHISKTFIGLILLPIVGNAAEHVTAVVVAYKNKMDLAIGVAIGSSMQIALLVTPFLVILGWIMDKPMTLHFETFETVVLFLSVLITNYLISVRLGASLG